MLVAIDRWLVEIRNGNYDVANRIIGCFNGGPTNEAIEDVIHILTNMLVSNGDDSIKAVVKIMYLNFISRYSDPTYLEEEQC